MNEEKQGSESGSACCRGKGGFFCGFFAGLLLAAAGFGLYMLGRCHNMCPYAGAGMPPMMMRMHQMGMAPGTPGAAPSPAPRHAHHAAAKKK